MYKEYAKFVLFLFLFWAASFGAASFSAIYQFANWRERKKKKEKKMLTRLADLQCKLLPYRALDNQHKVVCDCLTNQTGWIGCFRWNQSCTLLGGAFSWPCSRFNSHQGRFLVKLA